MNSGIGFIGLRDQVRPQQLQDVGGLSTHAIPGEAFAPVTSGFSAHAHVADAEQLFHTPNGGLVTHRYLQDERVVRRSVLTSGSYGVAADMNATLAVNDASG